MLLQQSMSANQIHKTTEGFSIFMSKEKREKKREKEREKERELERALSHQKEEEDLQRKMIEEFVGFDYNEEMINSEDNMHLIVGRDS